MARKQSIINLYEDESPDIAARKALTVLAEAMTDKSMPEKIAFEILSEFIEQRKKVEEQEEKNRLITEDKVRRYYIAREKVEQNIRAWFKNNATHASQIVLGDLTGKHGYPTYWEETPSDGEYPNNWVKFQICIKFPLNEKVVYFKIPVEGNPYESNDRVRLVPVVTYEIYEIKNGEIVPFTQVKHQIGWYRNMKDWEFRYKIMKEIYDVPLYQNCDSPKFEEFLRVILGYYPE